MKINWDEVINKNGGRMGVGIVVRDHNGVVVGAMCVTKSHIINPTIAEAVKAWQALALGKRLGLTNIIIEGVSLEVVSTAGW
ncbi:hypothetical protein FH972_015056 [Carpinus fangiana]|uniref:RNase H type-1 domain-containing protein n=1 Tax=Carpinus fangiana TaxID=176857 RepID=A0A5N6RF75_9ROSI|nr:hypothetical protein FH972_015056 [Carpinus fangiana]